MHNSNVAAAIRSAPSERTHNTFLSRRIAGIIVEGTHVSTITNALRNPINPAPNSMTNVDLVVPRMASSLEVYMD